MQLRKKQTGDTPLKDHADWKLQPLDKNYVTTGILYYRIFQAYAPNF